jgi:HprK-related kinase A
VTVVDLSRRTIADLGEPEFAARLAGMGLGVRIGPFDVKLESGVRDIDSALHRLYRDYALLDGEDHVFNIHLRIVPTRHWRRPQARMVRLLVDGRSPHDDLPLGQALAVVEWGLNLVIALRSHSWLMLHSAAVERHGGVLLLPAWPGSGKTTLCTALVFRGWRLFSDEFGLVEPLSGAVAPIPRPMPLKNESIEVIRGFAPDAELGPTIPNTRKGTIAHVKPPAESIHHSGTSAPARWIVFPRWSAGAQFACEEMPKLDAFMMLATNAFNYEMLGESAFTAVRRLVESARCFRLVYSDLDRAVAFLNGLADSE